MGYPLGIMTSGRRKRILNHSQVASCLQFIVMIIFPFERSTYVAPVAPKHVLCNTSGRKRAVMYRNNWSMLHKYILYLKVQNCQIIQLVWPSFMRTLQWACGNQLLIVADGRQRKCWPAFFCRFANDVCWSPIWKVKFLHQVPRSSLAGFDLIALLFSMPFKASVGIPRPPSTNSFGLFAFNPRRRVAHCHPQKVNFHFLYLLRLTLQAISLLKYCDSR